MLLAYYAAGSTYLTGVRPSVPSSRRKALRRVCCCGPGGQATAAAVWRRNSTAHSSEACGGRMRAQPCCQRT